MNYFARPNALAENARQRSFYPNIRTIAKLARLIPVFANYYLDTVRDLLHIRGGRGPWLSEDANQGARSFSVLAEGDGVVFEQLSEEVAVHPKERGSARAAVVRRLAKGRLTHCCPYTFYFRDVEFDFDRGVLTLEGRVGSFFLKQKLQEILKGMNGVKRIRNNVDVVSSTGLSSVFRE